MSRLLRKPRRSHVRRGVALSIELVMSLPLLIIVLVAGIEFTMLLHTGQGLSAAADLGSREAALPSATKSSVEAAVARGLQTYAWAADAQTLITVNDVIDAGQTDGTELAAAQTGDVIVVTVTVPAVQAAPDALAIVNIVLGTQELSASFVTRRE